MLNLFQHHTCWYNVMRSRNKFGMTLLLDRNYYLRAMNIKIADLEFEPLIPYETIQKITAEIAAQLNVDYADKSPIFVGVLNGAFMFIADLLKEVTIPCEVAFTKLSTYHGGLKSS